MTVCSQRHLCEFERVESILIPIVSLPADFAVWAASKESLFLGSGRYFWAHWDVTELKEKFDRVKAGTEKDGIEIMGLPGNKLFTLGLVGWV